MVRMRCCYSCSARAFSSRCVIFHVCVLRTCSYFNMRHCRSILLVATCICVCTCCRSCSGTSCQILISQLQQYLMNSAALYCLFHSVGKTLWSLSMPSPASLLMCARSLINTSRSPTQPGWLPSFNRTAKYELIPALRLK